MLFSGCDDESIMRMADLTLVQALDQAWRDETRYPVIPPENTRHRKHKVHC